MDELPNKDEIVARIRKINGQHAAEDDMTPEEKQQVKQAEEEKAKEQAQLKQIQQAMTQIALALQQAKVSETNAKAMKEKIDGEMKRLEGFLKALEVAATVQVAPQLTEAADQIVAEAAAMDQPQQAGPPQQGSQPGGQQ
jgi:biopolymer transport protein ExbB/TolQ